MNSLAVQTPVIPSVNMDDFKNGMRNLAGAVNVITVRMGDEVAGLTATAVMSVTAEPPRIMVCINKDVYAHSLIKEGSSLCVNVLAAEQIEVAKVFAGMNKDIAGAERFQVGDWQFSNARAPQLKGALLNLQCQVAEVTPASSHSVILCEVEAVDYEQAAEKEALIYFDCAFASLQK